MDATEHEDGTEPGQKSAARMDLDISPTCFYSCRDMIEETLPAPPDLETFDVAGWSVDLAERILRRGSEAQRLRPLEADLLAYLVKHRGRVVEKSELFEIVWQGAAVEDGALPRSISELRKALDDDARHPRIIATVPKRGYRFIAEVVPGKHGELPEEKSSTPSGKPGVRRWLLWATAGLIFVMIAVAFVVETAPPRPTESLFQDGEELPSDPEAIRFYTDGLLQLRRFEAASARLSLEQALALEPGRPYVQLALAEAWSDLGDTRKAREISSSAAAAARSLPRRQQLWIEARSLALARRWQEASELYRELWDGSPHNLEYGIDLARSRLENREPRQALEVVAELRGRGGPQAPVGRFDELEARAASLLGEQQRAVTAGRRAAQWARQHRNTHLLAKALSLEGAALYALGETEEAWAKAEEANVAFLAVGDGGSHAWTRFRLAIWSRAEGEHERAERLMLEALKTFQQAEDRLAEAIIQRTLGAIAAEEGDSLRGEKLIRSSLVTIRELEDPFAEAQTLNSLAIAQAQNQQYESASEGFGKALALFRRLGNQEMVTELLDSQAHVLMLEGRVRDASDRYRDALQVARDLELDRKIANIQLNRGFTEVFAGNSDQALSAFEEAVKIHRRVKDRSSLAASLDGLGYHLIYRLDLERAEALIGEALKIRRELGSPMGIADSLLSRSRLLLETGRAAQARAAAAEALEVRLKGGLEGTSGRCHEAQALLVQTRTAQAWKVLQETEAEGGGAFATGFAGIPQRIAAARIRTQIGRTKKARELLEEVRKSAEMGGAWLYWAEAELALGELEAHTGQTATARRRLEPLAKASRERGIELIARRAREIVELASG